MTETLAHGYSSESTWQKQSNEYQHDRVYMVFKSLWILIPWVKVALALEGLTPILYVVNVEFKERPIYWSGPIERERERGGGGGGGGVVFSQQ